LISAGEVGATFRITDEASGVLQRLADEFNRLQGPIDKLKESLAGIGGAEDGPLAKLREQFGLVGKSGTEASGIITEAFGKVDGAVDGTIGRVNALKESLAGAAREAEALKIPGMGGFGGGGMGGGGEEGHGGRGGLMRQLEQHGAGPAHFASSLIGGPAGAVIGGGMLGYEWFKEAGSVAQAENNLRLAGVSDAGVKQADAEAGNYAQFGMSKLEALNAIRATMGPLNVAGGTDTGVDAATSLLPTMAKFSQLARSMKGEGGGDASAQMYELIKGGELRNKLSPEEMGKFIEDYSQVYEGTGGKVDPKMYYQGLKYAKSAGGFFSDDFVKNYLPGIEAEEGGSTAGTMLMTSASAFLGQRFKKPALGELRHMGIYDENDKLQNQDQLVENPFKWMQETFMPALVKAGFTTQDQQIGEVEKLTSRNSAEVAALLGIRPGNVERTAAAIGRSDTLDDATKKIGDNDPLASMAKVQAGMGNLAAAFGGPFIPSITGGLSSLANALNWTASLTKPHLGPDGKPLMLDSAHDETPDWLRSFATPSSSADKEAILGHQIAGRDPRSPSSGPLAYSPSIAAPPSVTVAPALTVSTLPVTVNVDNGGLFGKVTSYVDAKISAALSGVASSFQSGAQNSPSFHDSRMSPPTTDMGGIGHN
jgi:hypothetical protein